MHKEQLSLVLPCYKPEHGWSEKILYYYNYISKKLPETELFLVIVNDGTPEMVSEEDLAKFREGVKNFSYYYYNNNMGKGYALRYGIARAITSPVIYTDIDFPYSINSLCNVASLLKTYDVVIGIKSSEYYSKVPFWRRKISKILQAMIRFFFKGIVTADTQCGLKGLKGEAKNIFLKTRTNDYLFDLEFIADISGETGISVMLEELQLRENVKFGKISIGIIFRELGSFCKIIFTRRFSNPQK